MISIAVRPNLFAAKLMDWYAQHKRELPWRGIKDPYIIWLSEIILQQTRVEQGLPYFEKFLELFPDVFSLANATEHQVLKAWEGLGYYSRARNLHKTAQLVVAEFDGSFPKSHQGLVALPGIGPYTAAAIASICFDERTPVIDGNVNRFISRLTALQIPVDTALGRKAIHNVLLEAINKVPSPGDFNQALMEFGARQCVPRAPECHMCLFETSCAALELDLIEDLPIKKSKTKVRERYIDYHVLLNEGKTYVNQRTEKGIWQGLFEFILEESPSSNQAYRSIVDGDLISPLMVKTYTHILSHQRIHARFIVYPISKEQSPEGMTEVSFDKLGDLAMARITTRFLEENRAQIQAIVEG